MSDSQNPDKRLKTLNYAFDSLGEAHQRWKVLSYASGAAIAAGFGVALTELITAIGGALNGWRTIVALVVVTVSSLLLALASARLETLGKLSGTVYFLRYQFPGYADWHKCELAKLIEQYDANDLRVVTRDVTVLPEDGVIDMSADVSSMVTAFETALNTDESRTGIHIAPDLQWMAAVALGSQMYGDWDNQHLDELRTDDDVSSSADNEDLVPFGWQISQLPEYRSTRAFPVTASQDFKERSPRVLVSANLTSRVRMEEIDGQSRLGRPFLRDVGCRYRKWYGVGVFEAADNERITVDTPCLPVEMEEPFVRLRNSDESTRVRVHPVEATLACVSALRRALHENPTDTILFAAQVPKTVSLAIGWHLTRDSLPDARLPQLGANNDRAPADRCLAPCCINPWRRLVPMYYDVATQKYTAARVHPLQPSVGDIRALCRDGAQ
ncbi:MAG: hypothetical protein V9G15_12745 [Dermatophilaceae bacterium]|nr:hypothetical protein [Actinomycetales bacterium]